MNFLIDFDTRLVECKSSDANALQAYIKKNELGLAVSVIGSADDMLMEMSTTEVTELYQNYSDKAPTFKDEEDAADSTYELLKEMADKFPNFTPALGNKLTKVGAKRSSDTGKPAPKPVAKPTSKVAGGAAKPTPQVSRGKHITGSTVLTLGDEPKANTLPRKIWDIIDDNMGEATVDEVTEAALANGGMDADACRKQISRCIRKGFVNRED